jgi:radical SAM-linked protein
LVQLPWDHIDTLVKREFNAREYTKGIKAKISPPCELPVKVIDGRPTAIAPSHEDFERVASRPLLCYACGLECDLSESREHLDKAYALHKEVRTYQERVAPLEGLVQLQRSGGAEEQRGGDAEEQRGGGAEEQRGGEAEEQRGGEAEEQRGGEAEEKKGREAEAVFSSAPPHSSSSAPAAPLFRYRATFEKGEEVKYLSHLDLTRALPRAFRRANIKLGYSAGYHPMPLIQYGPALGVGTVGLSELIDFTSPDLLEEQAFLERINRVLPSGLRFNSLARLQAGTQSLIKELNRAEYSVMLDTPEIEAALARICASRADMLDDFNAMHGRLIDDFMSRESWMVERARKDKRQLVDVRRFTKALRFVAENNSLHIVTEVSPAGGVKPIELMAAVYGLTEAEAASLSSRVRRLRLYKENQMSRLESSSFSLPARTPNAELRTSSSELER